MTDAPTISQIEKARILLRQACELALQIEAMDSYAPDNLVDIHRREFLRQVEYAAFKLGYQLSRPVRLAVDNSTEQPVVFGR